MLSSSIGPVSRLEAVTCARIAAHDLFRFAIAAPTRLSCCARSQNREHGLEQLTYLCNLAKVADYIAIAFNKFSLHIKSEAASCFGRIVNVTFIKRI